MPQPAKPAMFRIVERVIVNLYDGGVLSPAVLERVLAAFAGSPVEWNTKPDASSVDGRSLHEIVVSIMMPGKALRNASAEFARIVEHIAQASDGEAVEAVESDETPRPKTKQTRVSARKAEKADEAESDEDNDELVSQLSGSTKGKTKGRARGTTQNAPQAARQAASGKSAGFNPFVNAALPRKAK